MRQSTQIPLRGWLALLAISWTIGAGFFLAAWRGSVAADGFRHAPTCTEAQAFTQTRCQVTLNGEMTGLTSSSAQIDVAGRHVTANVGLAGKISDVRGVPVQVAMYQGHVMHVEGPGLSFDGAANPGANADDQRTGGVVAVILSTVLIGVNLLIVRVMTGRWPAWAGPPLIPKG